MKLNSQQLSEIKVELKKFSTVPIEKSYKLIAQVYKCNFQLQSLIDSQITKSFVRIGQKKYTDHDDDKFVKAIKISIICNDLNAQNDEKQNLYKNALKQKISKNNEPLIQKRIKTSIETKNEQQKYNIKETQNIQNVQEDRRKKAIDGLKKYFFLQTQQEHEQWSKKIEQTIYDLYNHSVQIYMDKVKCIVRMIDRN
ncbi:unnamed protein product [Paramecium sonneborni]|uniref:Uncharacterized protein n=1 Tax=Paramecium sonneborni TaxID=65129 RepID=A0A8S1QSH2_9CILI|nr:unnamed protein product [Paramecium sonneborni]